MQMSYGNVSYDESSALNNIPGYVHGMGETSKVLAAGARVTDAQIAQMRQQMLALKAESDAAAAAAKSYDQPAELRKIQQALSAKVKAIQAAATTRIKALELDQKAAQKAKNKARVTAINEEQKKIAAQAKLEAKVAQDEAQRAAGMVKLNEGNLKQVAKMKLDSFKKAEAETSKYVQAMNLQKQYDDNAAKKAAAQAKQDAAKNAAQAKRDSAQQQAAANKAANQAKRDSAQQQAAANKAANQLKVQVRKEEQKAKVEARKAKKLAGKTVSVTPAEEQKIDAIQSAYTQLLNKRSALKNEVTAALAAMKKAKTAGEKAAAKNKLATAKTNLANFINELAGQLGKAPVAGVKGLGMYGLGLAPDPNRMRGGQAEKRKRMIRAIDKRIIANANNPRRVEGLKRMRVAAMQGLGWDFMDATPMMGQSAMAYAGYSSIPRRQIPGGQWKKQPLVAANRLTKRNYPRADALPSMGGLGEDDASIVAGNEIDPSTYTDIYVPGGTTSTGTVTPTGTTTTVSSGFDTAAMMQMMMAQPKTELPKQCVKRPNSIQCIAITMSQQTQQQMQFMITMIMQMMQEMMNMMNTLSTNMTSQAQQCAAGYTLDEYGNCVPTSVPTTQCPTGYGIDPTTGQCMPFSGTLTTGIDPNTGLPYGGNVDPRYYQSGGGDPYGTGVTDVYAGGYGYSTQQQMVAANTPAAQSIPDGMFMDSGMDVPMQDISVTPGYSTPMVQAQQSVWSQPSGVPTQNAIIDEMMSSGGGDADFGGTLDASMLYQPQQAYAPQQMYQQPVSYSQQPLAFQAPEQNIITTDGWGQTEQPDYATEEQPMQDGGGMEVTDMQTLTAGQFPAQNQIVADVTEDDQGSSWDMPE
jgi:hypothetical protein